VRLGVVISITALAVHVGARADARTWYVKPDGTGDAPTIQAGIDSARAGDDVLLAAGTYTWSRQGSTPRAMLHLRAGLWLHGESGAGATTLDAEFKGRILFGADLGTTARIDGLTVTHGRAVDPNDPGGGGMLFSGDSHPVIRDCVFRDNDAISGGAISCDDATLESCAFSGNRALEVPGAGIDPAGGALRGGTVTIRGCSFLSNSVTAFEGVTAGGAILAESAVLIDCDFDGNLVQGRDVQGGAVCTGAAAVQFCTFTNNVARADLLGARGGAICLSSGDVSDCTFVGNGAHGGREAPGTGGGAQVEGFARTVRCLFARNSVSCEAPFGGIRAGVVLLEPLRQQRRRLHLRDRCMGKLQRRPGVLRCGSGHEPELLPPGRFALCTGAPSGRPALWAHRRGARRVQHRLDRVDDVEPAQVSVSVTAATTPSRSRNAEPAVTRRARRGFQAAMRSGRPQRVGREL
jgi:predicted outer membrane repeat protein